MLYLYNDLTRKREKFTPLKEGEVTFYSCGPTVYDFFHVGNARPFIVFDVLRRWLEASGYKVKFAQNFTDVDDKMIKRANLEGCTVGSLAERFIAEYYKDADALGVKHPTVAPRATEHMAEIIALVQKIVDNGHAYVVDGDVYFDVSSWKQYGQLTTQTLDEMMSGARVDVDERKRNPLDFALWKAEKPGEPSWESPWGKGRPGWHIECSAMGMKHLGETIDIHSGGVDLAFPHHENEIAQAESATGKQFVRFWVHNGFLLIDKEKMSKSLGNFLTARAAREKFPPLAIRLFMLSAHYRSPINFAPEGLEQAASGVERISNCWRELMFAKDGVSADAKDTLSAQLTELREKFNAAMDDDFNTAAAIGVVFEAVRAINTRVNEGVLCQTEFDTAQKFMSEVYDIMGIFDKGEDNDAELAERVEKLIAERKDARKSKNFARADEIRDTLAAEGIVLEDTMSGTKWYKNK